jgi:hypothetical protein
MRDFDPAEVSSEVNRVVSINGTRLLHSETGHQVRTLVPTRCARMQTGSSPAALLALAISGRLPMPKWPKAHVNLAATARDPLLGRHGNPKQYGGFQ